MYCPQCGTESPSGLQYCRSCGANLKVIGKAVALSEAIARSDRGPLPKIKEMVKGLKVEHVTEEVSRALDKMNSEIANISPESRKKERRALINLTRRKTAAERRERHLTKGVVSLFSGAGLMTFLYFLSSVLVLKLPPDVIAQVPFELGPVVHVIWLLGLIPMLSGAGHIMAGLLIRPTEPRELPRSDYQPASQIDPVPHHPLPVRPSVTDRTTELLEPESTNR